MDLKNLKTIWSQASVASLQFMISNLIGKAAAACAQIYAIFVFTKMHSQSEASIIFLLMGYAIWFQVLECGMSQTLQNRFNARKSTAHDIRKLMVAHYSLMIILAISVAISATAPQLLLPEYQYDATGVEFKAFTLGSALMIIATNNVLTQRLLLILNRGLLANALLILQSFLVIIGLLIYQQLNSPNLQVAVLLFLTPAVLVNLPIVFGLICKIGKLSVINRKQGGSGMIADALRFWVLNILAAIFIGSDYYFVAHYLNSEQIVAYHIATRFYFFSFVAYYAYVQHQSRRLTPSALTRGGSAVNKIVRESVTIGLIFVTIVCGAAIALDEMRVFDQFTNGNGIGSFLLLSAYFYFAIRVFRDIGLVVISSAGAIHILYKVYLAEISLGLLSLYFFAKSYGGIGIFLSMALTCLTSTTMLYYLIKKSIFVQERNLPQ